MGVGNDGYLCEIQGKLVLVPFDYTGQEFILEKIWKGQPVDTAEA